MPGDSLRSMLGAMGRQSAGTAGVVPGIPPEQMPATGGMPPMGGATAPGPLPTPGPGMPMPGGPQAPPPMEPGMAGGMPGPEQIQQMIAQLPPEAQQLIAQLAEMPPEAIMHAASQLPPDQGEMLLQVAMMVNPNMQAFGMQGGGEQPMEPEMAGVPGAMPPGGGPDSISGQLMA